MFMLCFCYFYSFLSELDSATLTALDIDLEMESAPEAVGAQAETEGEPTGPAEVQTEGETCSESSPILPVFGPMTLDETIKDMKSRIKPAIEGLAVPGEHLNRYLELLKADRVIVEVEKIVELLEGNCPEIGCTGQRKVISKKLEGGVLLITHKCSNGHGGVWSSSSILGEKRGQKMYVSSVLLASSVLVSGNNFEKVALLAKSMNLNFVSSSTFSRVQSLYAVPSIRDMWDKMKEVVWKVFENDVLVVCGDGRMDSPGFSAKYCVYTMMEHYLNVIVDLEVVDKREAGGTSSLMEKMGCKRLLERMMNSLKLGEVVTDASRVIMKMVRELKGIFKFLFLIFLGASFFL